MSPQRFRYTSLAQGLSLLPANVALQIVKGMRTVYSESGAKARPLIEAEFRKVLTSYLEAVLPTQSSVVLQYMRSRPRQRSILPDVIHKYLVVPIHPHRDNDAAAECT